MQTKELPFSVIKKDTCQKRKNSLGFGSNAPPQMLQTNKKQTTSKRQKQTPSNKQQTKATVNKQLSTTNKQQPIQKSQTVV